MKILVSDPIAASGISMLKEHFQVDVNTDLTKEELHHVIAEYDALIVRSSTKVTSELLMSGSRLKVVGRAGAGVDNIDVAAATERGIIVLNAPEGNTISAAEHTIAMMTSLARNIPAANASLKAGEWKRSRYTGIELFGKTLGIIGAGRIGTEVAVRTKAMGMKIMVYDPYISSEQAARLGVLLTSLDELLSKADIITLHVPVTKATAGMIGEEQIAAMKNGARIINCARGELIDEQALYNALTTGKIAGAALDVFSEEPAHCNPLCSLPNVIVTPHLGASTEEAQINVAIQVAEQVIDALQDKPVLNAVNTTPIPAEVFIEIQPYLPLMHTLGSFYGQVYHGQTEAADILYSGEISRYPVAPLTQAFLIGLFSTHMHGSVNYVNVALIARNRGIKVTETHTPSATNYNNVITVQVRQHDGTHTIAGTLFGKDNQRIVRINQYAIEVIPSRYMLVTNHLDVPGVVGKCGLLLSEDHVNIAGMQLGRKSVGGEAVMVLQVDSPVPAHTLEKLQKLDGMFFVRYVEISLP